MEYNNDNLTHYGVFGMKWGKRKSQEDGIRRNPAVEKAKIGLTDANIAYNKAYQVYNKETLGGYAYSEKANQKLAEAAGEVKYAKKELSDAKTKVQLDKQSKKSTRQTDLEEKYKEQGFTKEEAELAAYKRVRTEKIIAVTAGVAITAATAYIAYKHYDNTVDKIIKSGVQLQNISTGSNKGVTDAFYASMTKMDNAKYRGIYGNQLKTGGPHGGLDNNVYETKIGVNNRLNLASKNSATKALNDLVSSNCGFAKDLESQLTNIQGQMGSPKQNKVVKDALRTLKLGKVNAKVYEALNLAQVDHSPVGQSVSKGFYDLLKTRGYDAIKDINDSVYSGYKSAKPIIVFNGASKTAVNSIRELGEQEIKKNMGVGFADIIGKKAVKAGAAYATAVFGISATAKAIEGKKDSNIVQNYRKEHPESTLSYNEIVRNYKKMTQ